MTTLIDRVAELHLTGGDTALINDINEAVECNDNVTIYDAAKIIALKSRKKLKSHTDIYRLEALVIDTFNQG